jgi:tRNA pseudouridine55 synthase
MILLVDKPPQITSNDVVQKIKKHFKYKKVGHGGTLDPLATGLLIIGCNESTKLLNEQLISDKEYTFEIKFGIATDTYDITGNVTDTSSVITTAAEIAKAVSIFPKQYDQTVPIYSAVKINGKKLYEYARRNEEVILPSRHVTINSMNLESADNDYCKITISVTKGFYIRSFAMDLAKSFGRIATITSLRRTKSGIYSIENATKLSDLLV